MAKKPSPVVKPPRRYESPNIPMSAIRRYARQVAEKFQPEKIILFGSHAYGTPHEWSDVDILVVMEARDVISQNVKIRAAIRAPFALDLIVRTPTRLLRQIRDGNWFLKEITERGKSLYEKRNDSMGQKSRTRLEDGSFSVA